MELSSSVLPLVILADGDKEFCAEIEDRLVEFGYDTRTVSSLAEVVDYIHEDENRKVVIFIDLTFAGLTPLLEIVRTQVAKQVAVYVWGSNPQLAIVDTLLDKEAYNVFDKDVIRDPLWLVPYIKRANRHLESQGISIEDPMTGLDTFYVFSREFGRKLKAFYNRGYPSSLTIMLLDLDGLKYLNDTYGPPAADEVIRMTADTLQHHIRSVDTICRYHEKGDEYLICFSGIGETEAIEKGIELQHQVSLIIPPPPIPGDLVISISFGVVAIDRDTVEDLKTMITRANDKMRAMKKSEFESSESKNLESAA